MINIPKIYELSYRWYEDYSPTLFIAPDEHAEMTGEAWQAYCNDLLTIAAKQILLCSFVGPYIGWDTLTDHVCGLLENRGWKKVEPAKAGFWGSIIIDDLSSDAGEPMALLGDSAKAIIEHNNRVKNGDNDSQENEVAL